MPSLGRWTWRAKAWGFASPSARSIAQFLPGQWGFANSDGVRQEKHCIAWITLHESRTMVMKDILWHLDICSAAKDVVFGWWEVCMPWCHPGLHPDLEEDRCHLCQQKEDQQLATVNVLPRFSHHRPGRSDDLKRIRDRIRPFSPYKRMQEEPRHTMGLTGNGVPQNCMVFPITIDNAYFSMVIWWLFDGIPHFQNRSLPVFGIRFDFWAPCAALWLPMMHLISTQCSALTTAQLQ